jgi:hypothetical protein
LWLQSKHWKRRQTAFGQHTASQVSDWASSSGAAKRSKASTTLKVTTAREPMIRGQTELAFLLKKMESGV